jgi:hypothetical protein
MREGTESLESSRRSEIDEFADELGAQSQAAGVPMDDERADLGDMSTERRQFGARHHAPAAHRDHEAMCMHRNLIAITR